jgi:hypothetical protein
MSSIRLTQAVTQVSATLTNGAVTVIDIPRPLTTPAEPPYAEGTDHVVRPETRREFEGGNVIVRLPSAFIAANIFLRRASIRRLTDTAQTGLTEGAFFPTGASTDQEFVRDMVNLPGNTLPTNAASDAVADLLGVEVGNSPGRSYPGVTLMANEFVRLELFNNSGGDITDAIEASYKMGRSQADTGKP